MIHKNFANIYDEFMSAVNYNSWYKFLKSFLKKNTKLKIADLGCGTGNLSLLFAKDGHDVLAIDISEDMLEIARSKNNMENLEFRNEDICNLKLENDYDFLMCNFDTVNYFENIKKFKDFLINSYNSLKKGGILIFDFVEEGIFEEMFENDIFIDETYNYTCIMRHEKKSKFKHLVEMTFFVREGELFRKYVENHNKIIYDTDKILELVREVGFEIYDSARNSEYGDSRVFLVCKK